MKIVLKGTKAIYAGFLFALTTILVVLSICYPKVLAENTFLAAFITHELMAFLIVVLTITFASVANINLQITTMIQSLGAAARRRVEDQLAGPLRAEVNSSAWLLFWSFGAMAVLLVLKGNFPHNDYVVSLIHAAGIVAVAINGIVLYDINRTIFALAPALAARKPDGEADNPEAGEGQR